MKQLLTLLTFCLLAKFTVAQELTPQVISTAGTSFINGPNVLDWTLGEPVILTYDNGTNQLSQGFHQNDLLITQIDNSQSIAGVTIFPNPTAELVNIQFDQINENNIIELFSAEGKLVFSKSDNTSLLSQIDMSVYANGVYLLKVRNKSTSGNTYQIVKTK